MSIATSRNIAIVMAIAAIVAIVPGAGTGAGVLISAVSLAFLAAIGLDRRDHVPRASD